MCACVYVCVFVCMCVCARMRVCVCVSSCTRGYDGRREGGTETPWRETEDQRQLIDLGLLRTGRADILINAHASQTLM